jgi:hypothetical protein
VTARGECVSADAAVYELGVYPAEGGRLAEEEIKVVEGK